MISSQAAFAIFLACLSWRRVVLGCDMSSCIGCTQNGCAWVIPPSSSPVCTNISVANSGLVPSSSFTLVNTSECCTAISEEMDCNMKPYCLWCESEIPLTLPFAGCIAADDSLVAATCGPPNKIGGGLSGPLFYIVAVGVPLAVLVVTFLVIFCCVRSAAKRRKQEEKMLSEKLAIAAASATADIQLNMATTLDDGPHARRMLYTAGMAMETNAHTHSAEGVERAAGAMQTSEGEARGGHSEESVGETPVASPTFRPMLYTAEH
uniref:Uncharacterized protein n=1 Tax=Palpitomonas bilix TaxID=652834 RepID=A0A7S3CV76_9EUKA|mmetsp:Transcript_10548/g.27640  ORF Transcript_10548/g.27640 Transcript_10548/m.27640 type:complete len:264 (+) Transcript_10548:407-1198(+)